MFVSLKGCVDAFAQLFARLLHPECLRLVHLLNDPRERSYASNIVVSAQLAP